MYIVYKTTNKTNGKIYIGIHKQVGDGFDGYYGSGVILSLAISKYGINNFERETLFTYETLDDARNKEREIVNEEFCASSDNYNISCGGTGGNTLAGYSEEVKKEIYQKRLATNIEKGNFIYTGEKLERAVKRMKAARIQPENKDRVHTKNALGNMKAASKKRKDKYTWISNGNEEKLQCKDDIIPVGWSMGRSPHMVKFVGHTEETKKLIAEKIRGDVCYNNGELNIKLKAGQKSPEGFSRGMLQKHSPSKWITDGVNSKKLLESEELPQGWRFGRNIKKV